MNTNTTITFAFIPAPFPMIPGMFIMPRKFERQ